MLCTVIKKVIPVLAVVLGYCQRFGYSGNILVPPPSPGFSDFPAAGSLSKCSIFSTYLNRLLSWLYYKKLTLRCSGLDFLDHTVRLRGRSQTTFTRFVFFDHLPPSVYIFYGISLQKYVFFWPATPLLL